MTLDHDALDQMIPLKNASHADVAELGIDLPMRYAECVLTLGCGRTTRLRQASQLLGWTMSRDKRRYFFRAGDRVIQIRTDATRQRRIRDVECWSGFRLCRALSQVDPRVDELGDSVRTIVAPDGGLLFIAPDRRTTALNPPTALGRPQQRPAPAAVPLAT